MAISGLTEAQNHALAGVKVGDLILINHGRQHTQALHGERSEAGEEERSDDSEQNAENHSDTVTGSVDGAVPTDVQHSQQAHSGQVSGAAQVVESSNDNNLLSGGADWSMLPWATVYVVTSVCHNAVGELSSMHIYEMFSSTRRGELDWPWRPNLYGRSLTHILGAQELADLDDRGFAVPITNWACPTCTILVNPDGDTARQMTCTDYGIECPGSCSGGWLDDIEHLEIVVPADYDVPTKLDHVPVCPVCIGLDLCKTQQTLRSQLEFHHNLSFIFDAVLDFYGTLNVRRRELGLPFEQFDEREWGIEFTDMLSDDSDGDENAEEYEVWDEADDPNAQRVVNPTSKHIVDALPRKQYTDVKGDEEGDICTICTDAFELEHEVVVLRCKHFFCEECIMRWLLDQSNTCPTCRTKVAELDDIAHAEARSAVLTEGSMEVANTSDTSANGETADSTNVNNGDVAMVDA